MKILVKYEPHKSVANNYDLCLLSAYLSPLLCFLII
jgi:hypothetical protein